MWLMSFRTGTSEKGFGDISCFGPRASAALNSWYTLPDPQSCVRGDLWEVKKEGCVGMGPGLRKQVV